MKPEIHVFKDVEELSRAAAELFIELAAKAIAQRDRFRVALYGGNTPIVSFTIGDGLSSPSELE
jgi:6-phosphogluconolactonase/glucosamine-6-phosphate isomerase/deaminase